MQFLSKIRDFYQKQGKTAVLVTLGLIGILLIALSQLTSSQKAAPQATSSPQSDEAYCKDLEEKIVQLVSAITGDRECVVAVTLENGSQYVYADQNKIDSDQTEDKADGGISTRESRKSEQEYIIIKGEDGVQTALVVTEKKPSVRGVAIVTDGITETSKEQIMQSVSSMLGIASRRISITAKAG